MIKDSYLYIIYAFMTYLTFSYFFSISRLLSLQVVFFQIVTNLQNIFQYIYLKIVPDKWVHRVQTRVVQWVTYNSQSGREGGT